MHRSLGPVFVKLPPPRTAAKVAPRLVYEIAKTSSSSPSDDHDPAPATPTVAATPKYPVVRGTPAAPLDTNDINLPLEQLAIPRNCCCCNSDIAVTKAVLLPCECRHAFCLDCARRQLFETMREEAIGIEDVSVYCPSCKQYPVVGNGRKGSNLVSSSVLASLAAEQALVFVFIYTCVVAVIVVYRCVCPQLTSSSSPNIMS